MTAGRKRAVLQYQLPTEMADELGQLVPAWSTVATHRGEVRAPRGTEATVALQVQAFVTLIVETRFPGAPFEPTGRLVDVTDPTHPQIYNIVSSSDPDGRRRRLVTYATEAVGETDETPPDLTTEGGTFLLA